MWWSGCVRDGVDELNMMDLILLEKEGGPHRRRKATLSVAYKLVSTIDVIDDVWLKEHIVL